METLEQLLKHYTKRPASRYWIGEKPAVRDNQLVQAILGKIGYPTTELPFDVNGLIKIRRRLAGKILSFTATRSLAYDWGRSSSEGTLKESLMALRDLDETACFFSNGAWGAWEEQDFRSWVPISNATFDAGLLGYDQSNAFIFWVEEED